MKFFSFMTLYAKRTVRDRMFLLIMLVFPLLLIWVLGTAFGGVMGGGDDNSEPVVKASLIYTITKESPMSDVFVENMATDNDYFSLVLFNNLEQGREKIIRNEYDAFVVIDANKITVYKNSNYNFNSSMGELIIKAFADEYNLVYEMMSINPTIMQKAGEISGSGGFTETVSFDRQRTPGAMDYYGITMTTMFLFYGIIFLGAYFVENRRKKTEDRIKASPASIISYQWGTAMGNIVLIMIQAVLIILIGILVFRVYWGNALGISALVILGEIIMLSAMGALMGLGIKNENAVVGISQILIPVLVFLGDGYTQIGGGGTILTIKKISPMYWINHGIMDAVYLGDYNKAFTSIIISLAVAVACTVIIVLLNRNRRVANG